MSQENVETVRALYAPEFRIWDKRVLDHMSEHAWHPDIDWRAIEGAPAGGEALEAVARS